jgi:hypothetical protein
LGEPPLDAQPEESRKPVGELHPEHHSIA